jgi:hypothetical protein
VIISTQLDRVPSIFRKVFELKAKGDDYVRERPKDGPLPKYWNNEPKTDESMSHGFHEMAQMKQVSTLNFLSSSLMILRRKLGLYCKTFCWRNLVQVILIGEVSLYC